MISLPTLSRPSTISKRMTYILALDQGTTSSRSIVFDHEGNVVSVGQKEYRQIYPESGWVKHVPPEMCRVPGRKPRMATSLLAPSIHGSYGSSRTANAT